MINQIDQTFYRAKRKNNDGINMLWYPYNGIFEHMFCQFDFVKYLYSNKKDLLHEWRADDWPQQINFFPSMSFIDNPIDVCITNHRQTQVFHASELAKSYHMPIVLIDHEPAAEGSRSGMIEYINKKMPKNVVFVASHSLVKESWMYKNDDIIEYGFKLCDNEVEKDSDFILIGDYAEEDAGLIDVIKNIVPGIETAGYNKNKTEAFGSVDNLIRTLSRFRFSVSAAQSIQPPLLQILSASQNCLVITSSNKWTESVFKNNETALLYKSLDDLKTIVKQIKKEEIDIDNIVNNARQMIEKDFNFENSQSKWKQLLTDISNRTFVI